jgi:hypothetical protein
MTRSRGNPNSQAEIELRRQKALELMKENPQASLSEVADAIGSSRSTLWRDLKALSVKLATTNLAEHEKRVAAQEAVLGLMEQALLDEQIEPDVANAWRQIRKDIAELRGLNAPSKSVVAHTSPSHDILYMKFRKAIFDLSEAQVDDVLAYATKLPREPVVTVRDASWFPQPEPKQLPGGEDETA